MLLTKLWRDRWPAVSKAASRQCRRSLDSWPRCNRRCPMMHSISAFDRNTRSRSNDRHHRQEWNRTDRAPQNDRARRDKHSAGMPGTEVVTSEDHLNAQTKLPAFTEEQGRIKTVERGCKACSIQLGRCDDTIMVAVQQLNIGR